MSRRSRRQPKTAQPSSEQLQRLVEAEVSRRLSQMALPPGAKPRALNQDALMATMQAQQSPEKQGTPMFSPGAPLRPVPGLSINGQPRQFSYPVGYNIAAVPRNTEETSFATLRNLAALYDGIQLCEQVWLDTVAKLTLKIKPRDEIIAEQGQSVASSKYNDKIRKYTDFFSYPDKDNGYDLKSWLRAAIRDQLQLDAVAIYVRRNRGGGVYSLELTDGSSVKPLIDARGRRPQPPYPAFQQFLYGVPAGLYTSDDMLYQRETVRTESIYGLSRVERIILRINQALRKEDKDLARFTDGNVPPGIMSPPDDGSQWTPEQLMVYQEMWDALLAGNDQARSRIKVIQPGSTLNLMQEPDIFVDFDRFLLNVTAACYSMTMADLGFTENVNKSSGESQENVFYRRAVEPLTDRYATLFTYILRYYFGEQDLVVGWSGFEESEDFNAMAASYIGLTGAGITSPTTAAHLMNLPWSGPEIPNFVMTKDGPMFLEDAAQGAIRQAAMQAKMAGFALASQPSTQTPDSGANSQDNDASSSDSEATQSDETPRQSGNATPPGSGAKSPEKRDESNAKGSAPPHQSSDKGSASKSNETARAINDEYQRWHDAAVKDVSNGNPVRQFFRVHIPDAEYVQMCDALQRCQTPEDVDDAFRAASEDLRPEVLTEHTGIMVAFMVKPEIAEQLALPDGEPAQSLHCTLAYLGDMHDDPPSDKRHPVTSLSELKVALQGFAGMAQPLSGHVGGIARFAPSPSSNESSPVIALVNVPGLQEWRRTLVGFLESAGFYVANDFDGYTPHITLAYIDADAPMPIDDLPTLPLIFDELCLAIGDDRYAFPIGNTATPSRSVEIDVVRADHPENPRAWRPPSETQLALETQLSKAVKAFIDQAKITRDGVTLPDEIAHEALSHGITDLLSEAIHEGRRIATGTEERALISAITNIAGRAVQLVGDIIGQFTEKVQSLIDEIFGSGEDIDPDEALDDVQSQADAWASDYAEMVGITEITAAVEEAVLDQGIQQGHTKKHWNAEPDACPLCIANAEASPIGIEEAWPSGDGQGPPLHPRCRCSQSTDKDKQ